MINDTKHLKHLHGENGKGVSLKEWARQVARDSSGKAGPLAKGWLERKGLRK